jgi:hypothetical protein
MQKGVFKKVVAQGLNLKVMRGNPPLRLYDNRPAKPKVDL